MPGKLFLIATPIGNLDDLSPRAAEVLRSAELICCEDTRHSAKLLNRVGAGARRFSLHEHNERGRIERVLRELRSGRDVALITDAGTPTISDPGFPLVRACRKAALPVVPIPGPSAAVAALSASGLPTDRFAFYGYPPEAAGSRRAVISEAADQRMTCIFYLSPHKAARQLGDMARVFGERPAVLARELTKIHEEFIQGTVSGLAERLSAENPRGELVLVIAGRSRSRRPSQGKIEAELSELKRQGLSGRSLAEALCDRLGLRRSEAYRLSLKDGESPEGD